MDKQFTWTTQDEWGQHQREYTQKGQIYTLKYTHLDPETGESNTYETQGELVQSWENGLLKLKPAHSLDYQFLQTQPLHFYGEEDAATFVLSYAQFDPKKYETLQALTKLANFILSKFTGENVQFSFALKEWEQGRKDNQLLQSSVQNELQLLAFYEKASAGVGINLHLQGEKLPFNFSLSAKNYHFLGQNKQKVQISLLPLREKQADLDNFITIFLEKNPDFQPI